MNIDELTDRQREIFQFFARFISAHQRPPSVREMGAAFDIKSPNGVMCHLEALEKKGFLVKTDHVAHCYRLTKVKGCRFIYEDSDEGRALRQLVEG